MLKKLLLIFSFSLLFLFISIISVWTNLSSNAISTWIEYQVNTRIPRQYKVDIKSANTHLSGFDLEQIDVVSNVTNETVLKVDEIKLFVNPINLVIFQEVNYELVLYEGSIEGQLDLFPDLLTDYELKNIQLNRNFLIRKTNFVQSNPVLNGKGRYIITKSADVSLDLNSDRLTLTGESKYTNLPFELPSTTFNSVTSKLTLKGSQAQVSLNSAGDIDANLSGTINLNWKNMSRSKLDLALRGTLKSDYESKLGFFKDLLLNYKDKSGQLSVKITGNFSRPNATKIKS